MESAAEIGEKVERQFDLELAAIRELDAFSDRLIDAWPRQAATRTEADRIIAFAVARGTTTFKAALHLILGGYGREALMLNRSLFEGMAVAHWVAAEPEAAAGRFAKANEYEIHLMGEKLRSLDPGDEPPAGAKELDEEAVAEAKKLFGRNNERLWTGHRNVWELVDAIEDQSEEPGRTVLRLYLRFEHQQNTKEMHASASALFGIALNPATVQDGRPGMTVRIGAGPDSLDGAMIGAFFNHTNLLSLLIDYFELGVELETELNRIAGEGQYAFAVIDPEQVRDVGRNQPCPCGSEKKFKDCHWDRVRRPS